MTMGKARWIVLLVGVLLPYVVRLPRGLGWLQQYTHVEFAGWVLLNVANAVAWGAILIASLLYQRPASLLAPSLLGFGFLAYAHYGADLAADAQAGLALLFIPIYALVPITIGAIIGYIADRISRSNGAR